MTTLTIEIPNKVEKTLTEFVEQLGGKIVAIDMDKKLSRAAKKKQIKDDDTPYNPEFIAKIEKSMKQASEGKVVKIALDDIWK